LEGYVQTWVTLFLTTKVGLVQKLKWITKNVYLSSPPTSMLGNSKSTAFL